MQFCKAKIDEFGKLNRRMIDFEPGVNVIYGENESGKTTMHTFLRTMLFGLVRGRGRAAIGDDWSRYEAWDSHGHYGGSLLFESGGRRFQLDRRFEKTIKRDRLFCVDDGEELSLKHGDLEVLLGQMTEKGYRNSISLEQNQSLSKEVLTEELRNQAANYSGSASDNIDVATALAWLKEERKKIEKKIKGKEAEIDQKRILLEQKRNLLEEEKSRKIASYKQLAGDLEEVENGIDVKVRRNIFLIVLAVIAIGLSTVFAKTPWNIIFSVAAIALEEIWYLIKKRSVSAESNVRELERMEREDQLWRKRVLKQDVRELEAQIYNLSIEEEECVTGGNDYQAWKRKLKVYQAAEERIRKLSSNMLQEAGHSGNLSERMSEIISDITDGKYEKVYLDEEMRCSVYAEGKKIPAEDLSRGTLEQLLFALRIAATEELYEEPMPVVLDDAFVYYDDYRLGDTLAWLARNRRQVLIFTCQSREEEILQSRGIRYHKVVM